MFILFIATALCEIFKFTKPNQKLKIDFSLDPENINTGFFEPLANSPLDFKVEIVGTDNSKIFYSNPHLKKGEKTHFSFNNTEMEDIELIITSMASERDEDSTSMDFASSSELHFKFESTIDSFNQKSSKQYIYEPAIYALNHVLKKLHDTFELTKETHDQSGNLKAEQKKMMGFVTGFSMLSLLLFAGFNFFQLYLMKSYLNTKKYL